MSLILSLLFLLMIIGLITIYIYLVYVLIVILNRLYVWITSVKGKPTKKKISFYSKKYFSLTIISIFLITILLYVHSRKVWMDDGSAYRDAKQYFVVGQILANFRVLLTKKIHPENPIMRPFNRLQESIFNQGKKYLPNNDGEIGVWRDLWFLYPYVQVMHVPKGTSDTKPSYKMRNLLDDIWFALKHMATKNILDKKIREKYYLNFPRLVFYYELNRGFYYDKLIGSAKHMLNDSIQIERNRQIIQWLYNVRNTWIDLNVYEHIKANKPVIETLRQATTIMIINKILCSKIWAQSFECGDELIKKYIDTRLEFVSKESKNNSYEVLYAIDQRKALLLYEYAIDSLYSSFMKKVIEKYCEISVPGNEKFWKGRDKAFLMKMQQRKIDLLFKEELKHLKEKFDG